MDDRKKGFLEHLHQNALVYLPQWLPGGSQIANIYLCAGWRGGEGDYLEIDVQTGRWIHRPTNANGYNLLTLYCAIHGLPEDKGYDKLYFELNAAPEAIAALATIEPELSTVTVPSTNGNHDDDYEPPFKMPHQLQVVDVTPVETEKPRHSCQTLWEKYGLALSNSGPYCNMDNVMRIFEGMELFKDFCYYEEFKGRIFTSWRTGVERELGDQDTINILRYFQRDLGMHRMTREAVWLAITNYAYERVRNGPKEYFESLTWDGTSRVDDFFSACFGAEVNDYTKAVSKNFWLAMIARIYQPGCQHDSMPMVFGPQGILKSSAFKAVAGVDWYSIRSFSDIQSKDFLLKLQGRLIIEFADLAGLSRQDEEAVKSFISNQTDEFRTPYDRLDQKHPRRCCFVGTTNRDRWSRDETGARRWWPIHCQGKVNIELIKKNRDQFFAESLVRYKNGEDHYQTPEDETKEAQESCREIDERESLIEDYLINHQYVTVPQIAMECYKVPVVDIYKHQTSIGKALVVLGWQRKKSPALLNGKMQRVWERRP